MRKNGESKRVRSLIRKIASRSFTMPPKSTRNVSNFAALSLAGATKASRVENSKPASLKKSQGRSTSWAKGRPGVTKAYPKTVYITLSLRKGYQ